MSYKKGRRVEHERKKYLEMQGYKVELATKGTRFSKQKDFFGYFDIIAFKKDHWLIEQVKFGGTRGFLKSFTPIAPTLGFPPNTTVRLVIRNDMNKKRGKQKWREITILKS